MAKLKEKRPQHAYEVTQRRATYQDRRHSEAYIKEQLRYYDADELKRMEFDRLHKFGAVTIPRELLENPKYTALRPATRSVFLWLLVKERIIQQKKRAHIDDAETRRLPWITATGAEIDTYAGTGATDSKRPGRHTAEHMKALQAAGLIDIKEERTGGRTEAKIYRIHPLDIDYKGYIKFPIKTALNPKFTALSHTARALYLVIWSHHQAEQAKTGKAIPAVKITFRQLQAYGIGTNKTISRDIDELRRRGFITATRGVFNASEKRFKMNTYFISTTFMYE